MSTTLPARAAALRERLTKLHQMSSNVAEASALEVLRTELARNVAQLARQVDKEKVLTDAGILVPEPACLVAVRKKASTLLERFSATPKSATLKRGQAWRTMLEEIDTASRELGTAVVSAWKGHRSTVFAGDTPGAIETKLAKTKSNNDAYRVYQTLYGQFKAAFDNLPADKATTERIRKLGVELEAAAKLFDFNVPDEVKSFLAAVQSVGGASLALLTPDVLAWLHEKGSMHAYRVKSADRA